MCWSLFTSQIIDPYSGETVQCEEPCTDYKYQSQTSASSYPAQTTFVTSKEACLLVIKFFELCKDSAR